MNARRGYFVSDLHLFTNRSQAHQYMDAIGQAVRQAHTFILGGDIFDFKWSTRRSLLHSIDEATQWIKSLMASNRDCAFYYLLGNHDAHPTFVAALDRLAFDEPRLVWQPYFLRLESCVFLHGDILDGELRHEILDARRKRHDDKPAPWLIRYWLYDALVQARVHRVVANVAKRHAVVLKKLNRYLADQGLDAKHGVTDVYFGHTHREMDGLVYHGLTYHNGGAPIKGLGFRILETQLAWQPSSFPSSEPESHT